MLRVTLQAWMHRELKEMIGNETALKEKSGVLVPEGRLRPVNYCRPTGA